MTQLNARLSDLIGVRLKKLTPLSGGDLSQVWAAEDLHGRALVAKQGETAATEARMLAAIARTGCPAPEVVAQDADLLVMTRLTEGRRGTAEGYADAGAAIARLHGTTGACFGWDEDTAFGAAPCPASPTDDWPGFWAERRLMAWPDALPADLAPRIEALAGRVADLLPRRPPPSLLHGDLWSGNLLFDGSFSGLIDPACYHGDAEVDLAMLTLFGAPRQEFWEAYGPLRDGWRERRQLYQLWPALVHLRLFGGTYRRMVEDRLAALGA